MGRSAHASVSEGQRNRCTCNIHTHHVYWRLDFDIRTPGHNVVEEFNDPEIAPAYVDVPVKRWQEFTGRPAVLDGDGRNFDAVAAQRPKSEDPA
jgi:hypothetical protein